jgi:hypothetical protein
MLVVVKCTFRHGALHAAARAREKEEAHLESTVKWS